MHVGTVPNSGSEVRDFCANERTCLAWIRLALTLAILTCAPVISQINFNGSDCFEARSIDLALSALSLITCVACLSSGLWTYYTTQRGYVKRKGLTEVGPAGFAAGLLAGCFLIGTMVSLCVVVCQMTFDSLCVQQIFLMVKETQPGGIVGRD